MVHPRILIRRQFKIFHNALGFGLKSYRKFYCTPIGLLVYLNGMYLYRTRERILSEINSVAVEVRVPSGDFSIAASVIIDRLGTFHNKTARVARGLAALSAQGYIRYVSRNDDGTPDINMTQRGLDALSTLEFRHLQHRAIGNIIRDTCGLLVALATIYALFISTVELKQTQKSIKTIQEEQRKQRTESIRQVNMIMRLRDSLSSAKPK